MDDLTVIFEEQHTHLLAVAYRCWVGARGRRRHPLVYVSEIASIDSVVVRLWSVQGHTPRGVSMNRIKRIAAATAVSTVVLAPMTAGLAFAEPDPGPAPQTSSLWTTKAHIEHEDRLQALQNQRSGAVDGQSDSSIGADNAGFPWETVGMAALAGAVLAGGGVVLVRRFNNEPSQA